MEKVLEILQGIRSDVDFMNEKEAFDMTEREWEAYSDKHPNAKRENHHIIPVPGKSYKDSDFDEYMQDKSKNRIF